MNKISSQLFGHIHIALWQNSARVMAQCMREYAEQYHADEKPKPKAAPPPLPEGVIEPTVLSADVESFIRNLKLPEFV